MSDKDKPTTDLIGNALTEQEQVLLDAYYLVKAIAERADLPPCAARNVRKALSSLWQVTNDLDLQFEQLAELGI